MITDLVIAALQLQNQNLLNAYIRNQSNPRNSGFQQRSRYQVVFLIFEYI